MAKQAELSFGRMASMWDFQVMESLMVNPKNFMWLALIIKLLSKVTGVWRLFRFLFRNWRKYVLLTFKDNEFSWNHLVNWWIDVEIAFWSSQVLGLVIIMLVSSANKIGITLYGTAIGKSLMYNKKSKGPNTDPCGTPWLTFIHSEATLELVLEFFSSTRWYLLDR